MVPVSLLSKAMKLADYQVKRWTRLSPMP